MKVQVLAELSIGIFQNLQHLQFLVIFSAYSHGLDPFREKNMQKNLCATTLALMICAATLTLGGCGTVGGTVAGLKDNESLKLLDNGGNVLTLSTNSAFSFPKSLVGSKYVVSVQSHTPGIACAVNNCCGTVGFSIVPAISVSCTVGTESILHSFSGPDGNFPKGLVMDSAGNLYGTTEYGGAYGDGTVFKIDPAGSETVLHHFAGPDGGVLQAGLVMDRAGNLYGTTQYSGAYDKGVVFKISAAGEETVLHSFGIGHDGQAPMAGPVMDGQGNLYGTTRQGGAHSSGTVFKISVNGEETVLHSFGTHGDGSAPWGALLMDNMRNLYGTTYSGGDNDYGTVFRITAAGEETVVHSFGTATDGRNPMAALVMDHAGNLYGTTYHDSARGAGTVFQISAAGKETVLHYFGTGHDGNNPETGLVIDSTGNLYGTTRDGGEYGNGTVFKIGPDGAETVIHSFAPTGAHIPIGDLVIDSAGNLYGTTQDGGASGRGTVFKIN